MTERRPRDFSKDAKIAQLLCMVFGIPHEDQVRMHELHVLSLAEWDHYPVRYADGGTNHFSNAKPRLIAEHREKTRTVDVPQIAKSKRIRRNEMVRQYKAAAKVDPEAAAALYPAVARLNRRKAKKIPARANPWPRGRTLQSRRLQQRRITHDR